jgi:hypothetical protein
MNVIILPRGMAKHVLGLKLTYFHTFALAVWLFLLVIVFVFY